MNSLAPRRAAPPHVADRGAPISAAAPAARPAPLSRGQVRPDGLDGSVDVSLLVRQRRVRFDTEREYVHGASGRVAVGVTLRLFALHDPGAHRVPACRCCRGLALQLRRLASTLLAEAKLDADVEPGHAPPALYESPTLPGRDEVALIVRLWPRVTSRPASGGEDGCSERLRRWLRQCGVPES